MVKRIGSKSYWRGLRSGKYEVSPGRKGSYSKRYAATTQRNFRENYLGKYKRRRY